MARYEVIARAAVDQHQSTSAYFTLAMLSGRLDNGMHLCRIEDLPDGRVALVLQHKFSPRKQDQAALMANRTLAQLGIPASQVLQLDLLRLSRKGPVLVRSWTGPGNPPGPDLSGDREPRNPLPNPPHLNASLDLPKD
ncbi:hypothetical protein [Streptomyces sp. SID13031]|uniref:hypothetical protein n=1 Tax=Streptomyces sp. SID13031 TaxID=2706046 RepID=UPI0013C6EAD5|nr:hypothetical protein [Streptomyces sp. SID13031]NEA31314.1 hypothetical protein [Streptomyces sp. SID13031]